MKIFDGHIHLYDYQDKVCDPVWAPKMLEDLKRNNIEKIALYAEEPAFRETSETALQKHNDERLARLLKWCEGSDGRILPVYYINPIEKDALQQVDRALDAGCIGFKVICETFFPGDERAMPVYQYIADKDKAVLFHSGTLWDYGANSQYNRPVHWECMFDISNIRFALAHISWPWCDELIATYGKFAAMAYSPRSKNQKLYIDLTPGTPECYRQNALNLLHDVSYDQMESRLLFGSDAYSCDFEASGIVDLAKSDSEKLAKAGFSAETIENILWKNWMEFWGV